MKFAEFLRLKPWPTGFRESKDGFHLEAFTLEPEPVLDMYTMLLFKRKAAR